MASEESRNMAGCQFYHRRDLPHDWDCVPLEERIELHYGSGLREEDRTPGNIPVYGSNGVVGTHTESFVEGPGILVGRKGTVGAVHYSAEAYWPIDTVYYVNPIANDNLRFIYYLIQHLPLGFLNAATGVPGLSRRDAYALRGAFPPLAEQAPIAQILDAADTAIERTRAAIDKARELQKSLLQHLLQKGIHNESPKRTAAGLIPTSWECSLLGNHIAEGPANGLYRPDSDYEAHGTPIVRIDSFYDGHITDLNALRRVVVDTTVIERYALKQGDILINRVNSMSHIGKSAIVPSLQVPTLFESNIMRFRCDDCLLPEFLTLVLCSDVSRKHWLVRAKPAVNQASINQRDVRALPVPLPCVKEQIEIIGIMDAIFTHIERLARVIKCQQTLKKSLMHDLLSGIKRVHTVKIAEQLELF